MDILIDAEQKSIRKKIIEYIINGQLDKIKDILPVINERIFKSKDRLDSRSLLWYAIFNNQIEIFEFLKNNLEYRDEYLLIEFFRYSEPYTIKREEQLILVLEYINDINLCDSYGQTALHSVLLLYPHNSRLYRWIITTLLEYGANPCIQNKYGHSPLDKSIASNMTETSAIFISHMNGQVDINRMMLIFNINHYNNYDMVELILPHITDINEIDQDGHTILHHAKSVRNPNTDIIELLELWGGVATPHPAGC